MTYKKGLKSQERKDLLEENKKNVHDKKNLLSGFSVSPNLIDPFLKERNSSTLQERTKISKILLRPGIGINDLRKELPDLNDQLKNFSSTDLEQAEIQLKYEVYIEKEKELVKKMSGLEDLVIPQNFNYQKLTALSMEARHKLEKIKPGTLGQASRISGVNPSDVQILMVYMGR